MFIPASTIKRRYIVKGRFYRVNYKNQNIIPCRSVLEILAREYEQLQSLEPDAFIVMENPGRSESLEISEGHMDGPLYLSTDTDLARHIQNTILTKAKPDRTQYQIMRLMNAYNWNHVRVINLSDIRTTNSNNMIELYAQLNDDHLSIFSSVRELERINICQGILNKPIITAWGTSDGLRELAILAMSKLPDHIKGLPGDKPYKFLHPLPRKYGEPRKWLERFINEVKF